METTIKQWGNSPALRIPKAILEQCSLVLKSPVDMRVEKGAIIIEPIKVSKYNLDDMLQEVTKDNIHKEVSFGKLVGKELL